MNCYCGWGSSVSIKKKEKLKLFGVLEPSGFYPDGEQAEVKWARSTNSTKGQIIETWAKGCLWAVLSRSSQWWPRAEQFQFGEKNFCFPPASHPGSSGTTPVCSFPVQNTKSTYSGEELRRRLARLQSCIHPLSSQTQIWWVLMKENAPSQGFSSEEFRGWNSDQRNHIIKFSEQLFL